MARMRLHLAFSAVLFGLLAATEAPAQSNGRIVYSNGTTTPQNRTYSGGTNGFSAAAATQAGAGQTFVVDRACPVRDEHLAGYVTTGGVLYILRWNGTAWSAEWNVTVGGAGVNGRRFDIAYEQASGDGIVVYSNNSTGANELRYRTWNGSSWTAATNLDSARLSATPNDIRMATRPGSDQVALAVADNTNPPILTALRWSGTAWGNEPGTILTNVVYRSAAAGDVPSFDVAFESASGDMIVANSINGANNINYHTLVGTTWSTATLAAGTARAYGAITLASNPDPTSNQVLLVASRTTGASATEYHAVWSGTAWSTLTTGGAMSANYAVNRRPFAAGWIRTGGVTAGIVFYDTATANRIDYYTTTNGGTNWTAGNTTAITVSAQGRYWWNAQPDPAAADRLLVTFSDAASDLWAKRVVLGAGPTYTFTNADGGTALTTALASITTENFMFGWDRQNPGTTAGTVTATASGCTSLAVSAPYTGDSDADNTLSYRTRTPSGTGAWSTSTNLAHSASPYSFTIPGLTHGATYDVEVTFVDADGVAGTSPQTVSNVQVGPNCTGAGTVTAAQAPGATPSIAVTAPYSFDANTNNTLSWRTRTPSGTGAWTAPQAVAHSTSPYSFTISGLTCGSGYDVEVTFIDADGIGSGTAVQTVTNVTLTNCTVAGTATGAVDRCDQITVSAPFTRDGDGDGATTVERGPTGTGPWTAVACSPLSGASPRSCVDTTVSASSTYWYRVTYTDADGVGGTAQQVIGAFSTPACNNPPVAPGPPTATATSCTQIAVSAPYADDTNGNSTTTVERGPSASGPWTSVCASLGGGSPRACAASGLTNATDYWFRVTFADPDGVNGSNPQVIGPTATADCRVLPGTPTATVSSCSQIVVSAPYSADFDADSTTTTSRGTSATGPWTAVCTNVAGASPRTCTDNGVTALGTWYYQVTFTDADGVAGTNPQVAGPYATPACTVTPTTVVSNAVQVSSCRQLTVTGTFTGDGDGDGAMKVDVGPSATGPWTTACSAIAGTSPRQCLAVGLTPSTAYWIQVTYTDPDGVSGTNPQVLGSYTLPACAADQVAPTVLFASPSWGAQIGGTERVKVQVFDAVGLAGANPVQWAVDAGALSSSVTVNANYNCDDTSAPGKCRIYEFDVSTTALSNGSHSLKVQATDAAGNVAVTTLPVQVLNSGGAGTGDGRLGRRTAGSQLCVDCHNLQTHSSQYTSTQHGNWAVECLQCHTPHKTSNVHLVRNTVRTPRSGNATVDFRFDDTAGGTMPNYSFLGDTSGAGQAPYTDGICEVCHTRTNHYRNDNSGGDHTHNQTQRCIDCHAHSKGFSAKESSGGLTDAAYENCSTCHPTIWAGMTGGVAKSSKHTLGATVGTNDSYVNGPLAWGGAPYSTGTATFTSGSATVTGSGTAWTSALVGGVISNNATGSLYDVAAVSSATSLTLTVPYAQATAAGAGYTIFASLAKNAAGSRSCVTMCHTDHVHNAVGGNTHGNNLYVDATSQANRTVARDALGVITGVTVTGTPAASDFDNAATAGGVCLSCHQYPVDAAHPPLSKTKYNASAHNYINFSGYGAWSWTQHDGSTTARNCSKCHGDPSDSVTNDSTTPFAAAHFSSNPSILTGTSRPNGVPATFVCYGCHGNGTTGTNRSGKDIATQIAKTRNHPSNTDNTHDSAAEFNLATFGNTLGVAATRHANCMDCHNTHEARAGARTKPGNLAGPPLEGAWGVRLSTNPAFWTDTSAASFTKTRIVAGTDLEATLCFKCHSRFYWGAGTPPTAPSGGAETDVAKEFNPANVGNFAGTWASGETAGGFHPVLATAGSNLGAVRLTNLVTTNIPWSTAARNLMSCGDCHGSNTTTDPNGPHGSAASYILRGPNTTWAATTTMGSAGMPAGTFCSNCHSSTFANTRFPAHYSRSDHRVACWNCHAAVPHGGPRPGMLVASAGAAAGVGGTIAGWDTTAPYWGMGTSTNKLYIASYPTNNTTDWGQNNCGCNGTGH